MNMLYSHPTLKQRNWQGGGKLEILLFCAGLMWVSALFFLLFPLGDRLAWVTVSRSTVAVVAMALLGIIAAATLIAQLRGYHVPSWIPLLPTLLLLVLMWWGWWRE